MYTNALIHSGASRKSNVDAVAYASFCWSRVPRVRKMKDASSQIAPIMITQQKLFRWKIARKMCTIVRRPKRTAKATAAEKEGL